MLQLCNKNMLISNKDDIICCSSLFNFSLFLILNLNLFQALSMLDKEKQQLPIHGMYVLCSTLLC